MIQVDGSGAKGFWDPRKARQPLSLETDESLRAELVDEPKQIGFKVGQRNIVLRSEHSKHAAQHLIFFQELPDSGADIVEPEVNSAHDVEYNGLAIEQLSEQDMLRNSNAGVEGQDHRSQRIRNKNLADELRSGRRRAEEIRVPDPYLLFNLGNRSSVAKFQHGPSSSTPW